MNLEESLRCNQLAKDAIAQRDYDKAERLLQKSIKMNDSEETIGLLNQVKSMRNQPQPTLIKETPNIDSRPFTEQQANICDEILAQNDYYQVLGVTKEFTENELKKGFRLKAVKVHPDKNSHPKANEAFQKVNQAMSVLSDPEKRRTYDQIGNASKFEERENLGGMARPEFKMPKTCGEFCQMCVMLSLFLCCCLFCMCIVSIGRCCGCIKKRPMPQFDPNDFQNDDLDA